MQKSECKEKDRWWKHVFIWVHFPQPCSNNFYVVARKLSSFFRRFCIRLGSGTFLLWFHEINLHRRENHKELKISPYKYCIKDFSTNSFFFAIFAEYEGPSFSVLHHGIFWLCIRIRNFDRIYAQINPAIQSRPDNESSQNIFHCFFFSLNTLLHLR